MSQDADSRSFSWPLAKAKAHLTELVDAALAGTPQIITRHGEDAVVVVAMKQYTETVALRVSIVDFFAQSPLAGINLAIERNRQRISADRSVRPTCERIGANLIIARAQGRLTQTQLARAAGVTRQTVSDIERSATNATVDVLDRLSSVLKIPIERLFISSGFSGLVDDDEIARRRALPRTERVNAHALHAAIKEPAGSKSKVNAAKKRRDVRG